MDIENMHPFCLPFGFCHDATSSSIAADFSNSTNNNNNNESSNSTSIENNSKDKVRSKTTSPTDELFRHLNNASSSASFLHEDLIIGSSTSLDLDGDGIYSLELGIDIDQHDDNNENNNNNSTFITNDDDDLSDLKEFNHDDDWFCNQYSLFSPDALDATASGHPGRRKSLLRTLFSHGPNSQVFQHVVDPIDIKSSPTLAQLNLNSNDDPTDGLWDTGAGTNHQNQASSTNIDLLSNCTSINRNSRVASSVASAAVVGGIHDADSNDDNCISNQHSTSCHLHHNHPHHHHHHLHAHHTHHQHSSGPQFVHLVSHRSTNTTCNHLHNHNHGLNQHHHHHQHQQQMSANGCCSEHSCGDTASAQHQCLAVPPFRKAGLPNQCPSACCHNNSLVATATQMAHANSNNGSNLKPSATLNQLNQQMSHNNLSNLHQLSSSSTTTNQQQQHHHHEKHTSNCSQKVCANHQQRSASPALVTSSSSPGNLSAENRLIDNKLKENIEYLTALLCNGNKMEASAACTNQQSSISSTMVRSYATLAHSLSTGPKLLERHLHTHGPQMSAASNVAPISAQLASATGPQVKNAPTNEASPCASAPGCNNNDQSLSQLTTASNTTAAAGTANPLKRQHGSDGQWFKYAVESSVSAADSTESQVTSLSNSKDSMTLHHQLPLQQLLPHPHLAHLPSVHQQPLVPLSNQHLCTHQASQLGIIPPGHHQMPHPDDHRRQRTPELKVLSSLLNSNKCASQPAQTNLMQHVIQPAVPVSGAWPNTRLITTTAPHQQLPVPPGSALGDQPNHVPVKTSTTSLTPQQSTDPSKQHVAQSHQVSNIPLNGKPITLTPIATSNGILAQQLKSQRAPHFAQPASPSASSTDSSGCGNTLTTNSSDTSSVTSISTNNNKRQRAGNDVTAASGQKGRVGRPNSLSTDCSMSSHDEGFASQIDNDDGVSMRDSDDDEDDIDSDDESFYGDYTNSDLIGASISDNAENKWTLNMGRTRRNGQKRYFWQYNVQSKGPKGTRICSTDDSEDPFVLPEASDPVFSNDCQIEGVKHSGKARRGDGNDLTPNPRKLLMIGLELKKLGKIINDLAPVTDLPLNARNKTRKEKNKLASRACRLKKKAQHEANKIKLYGLQREHQQVVMAIYDVRKLLNENLLKQNDKKKTKEQTQATSGTCQMMDVTEGSTIDNNNCDPAARQIAEQCSMRVAGQTSDYVNSVLEKVVSGCIDGGLQT